MSGFFETSVFFGVLITLLSYGIGVSKKLIYFAPSLYIP